MEIRKIASLREFKSHNKYGECKGSQAPCVEHLFGSIFRVWFSARDEENRSHPFIVDIDEEKFGISNPIANKFEICMNLGIQGTFNSDGNMPSQIIKYYDKTYLLFVGWNKGNDICRYRTSIGIGEVELMPQGSKYRIKGKCILDRCKEEPIGASMPFIDQDNETMYYMSYSSWDQYETTYEPNYGISCCYVNQHNLVAFQDAYKFRNFRKLLQGHKVFARPCLFKHKNKETLWYSHRDSLNYRTNKENAYKLGILKRSNSGELIPVTNFDFIGMDQDFMVTYPYVIVSPYSKKIYMFYNNNFTSGIQIAEVTGYEQL